ncbi:hypothetical protein [Mycobacterium sp.]
MAELFLRMTEAIVAPLVAGSGADAMGVEQRTAGEPAGRAREQGAAG